jgi:hypothetical protein
MTTTGQPDDGDRGAGDVSTEIENSDANDIASLPEDLKEAAKKSIPTPEDTPLP